MISSACLVNSQSRLGVSLGPETFPETLVALSETLRLRLIGQQFDLRQAPVIHSTVYTSDRVFCKISRNEGLVIAAKGFSRSHANLINAGTTLDIPRVLTT